MMVIKQQSAAVRCPRASQKPASRNQMILPSMPSNPVPISCSPVTSFLRTATLPKGKNENLPRTKQALAQGIPIIVIKATSPANHQVSPRIKPPKINHRIFPNVLIKLSLDCVSGSYSEQPVCQSTINLFGNIWHPFLLDYLAYTHPHESPLHPQ